MSRSVDPTELLMDLGFGGPAINSLARIPSRFFTKSHVSYILNNIGHEYLMSFYLKVVLLSNRMTSGIHTYSDSGIPRYYYFARISRLGKVTFEHVNPNNLVINLLVFLLSLLSLRLSIHYMVLKRTSANLELSAFIYQDV